MAKIRLYIIIIVSLLLVAGFVAEQALGPFGETVEARPIYMLCTNEQCGQNWELTQEEMEKLFTEEEMLMLPDANYLEAMADANVKDFNHPHDFMLGPGFERPKECKFCNQKTAFIAEKCMNCEHVFIPNYTSEDYPDRCPQCGYSYYEELRKKRKEEGK